MPPILFYEPRNPHRYDAQAKEPLAPAGSTAIGKEGVGQGHGYPDRENPCQKKGPAKGWRGECAG